MNWLKTIALFGVLFAAVMTFTLSCGKDDPIVGFNPEEGFEDIRRGQVDTTMTAAVEQVTLAEAVYKTGASIFLSLGSFKDVESRILLRFAPMPTGVTIRSATLLLRTNAILANTTSKTSLQASIHEATGAWVEDSVTTESFQEAFDPMSPLGHAEVLSTDRAQANNDTVSVEIVRIPFDDTSLPLLTDSTSMLNQNGILVNFSEATFIKEFFSRESSGNQPQLELSVDTDTTSGQSFFVSVIADAFLPRQISGPPQGPLYADGSFGNVIVMKFDLSPIPRFSTVNRASVQLNVSPELSLLKNDGVDALGNGITLQVSPLTEPFDPSGQLQFDRSVVLPLIVNSNSTSVTLPNAQFSSAFRSLMQGWINGTRENYGFVLHVFTPGLDVSRAAFVEKDARVATLEMVYSVAPLVNDPEN